MIIRLLKTPFYFARRHVNQWQTHRFVSERISKHPARVESFDCGAFQQEVLAFLNSLQTDETKICYRYAKSCTQPTLYASAYACMTYSLLNHLDMSLKESWVSYFDSFQHDDGLFYDPKVSNAHFNDSDWWGARHLALHMISAYTDLSAQPKKPFRFLEQYYHEATLLRWLMQNEDRFTGSMDHDFDNKLMNITCLLQYQRDFWNDGRAGKTVSIIQDYLLSKINPATGIWGDSNIDDPLLRSRKVQFAYHLLPFFFYDNQYTFDFDKITRVVLRTQNQFGGFGVPANSSACEDIDSLDILIRAETFQKKASPLFRPALEKHFNWVTANQVGDGGFVFRLNESFTYGHRQMSSLKNEGAIFPTWFRTLSLVYLCNYFKLPNNFKVTRCPGYEF